MFLLGILELWKSVRVCVCVCKSASLKRERERERERVSEEEEWHIILHLVRASQIAAV